MQPFPTHVILYIRFVQIMIVLKSQIPPSPDFHRCMQRFFRLKARKGQHLVVLSQTRPVGQPLGAAVNV